MSEIPLANRAVYRDLPSGGKVGCGLLVKPDLGWDFHDRLVRDYRAVLRGSGTYFDDQGRSWPLVPGLLLQRFTTRRHSHFITPDGRWAECWIQLPPAIERALQDLGALDPEQPVLTSGIPQESVAQIDRLRRHLAQVPPQDLLRAAWDLAGLLLPLLAAGRRAGRGRAHAVTIAALCRRLAKDPGLSLPDLAQAAGLSTERFRRVFQEETSFSLARFRVQCRIDLARQRLADPAVPLAAIAAELGYAGPAAFSACFRRETGQSPSEARRRG